MHACRLTLQCVSHEPLLSGERSQESPWPPSVNFVFTADQGLPGTLGSEHPWWRTWQARQKTLIWIRLNERDYSTCVIATSSLSPAHTVCSNIYRFYYVVMHLCRLPLLHASWRHVTGICPEWPNHRWRWIQTQGCVTCNSCIFVSSQDSKRRWVFPLPIILLI